MSFDYGRLPDPLVYYESEGLRLVGSAKAPWRTTECRFHGGSNSMRIHVASGGFRCMNCCAKGGSVLAFHMASYGLDFENAARALGAWIEDGKPQRMRRPPALSPLARLQLVSFEVLLAALIAGNMARGLLLSSADQKRLRECARRIRHISEDLVS